MASRRWRDVGELVTWLNEQPPGEAVRLARLLADTKTAGALREYADRLVFGATREATYREVATALGLSYKQVMAAAERQRKRLAA